MCVAGPDWEIWAESDEADREFWRGFSEQCQKKRTYREAAEEKGIYVKPCLFEETLICYIAAKSENGAYLTAFAEVVFIEKYSLHLKSQRETENRQRNLLTNLLAGAAKSDLEMESYFKFLRCSRDLYRCAVLCSPCYPEKQGKFPAAPEWIDVLLHNAQRKKILSGEDIYGIMNNMVLIFKRVSSLEYTEFYREVEETVLALSQCYMEISRGKAGICACAGSAYGHDGELAESYKEAVYLSSNLIYRIKKHGECLFINDFLFEYLYSGLDNRIQKLMIGDITKMLDENPSIAETVIALSNNDNSPIRSAKELGIHRNTMLQRIQKMKNEMALDPLYNTRDRAVLDIYSLQKKQKIVWNAGLIVQPGSIPYEGLMYLASLLDEKSGGTFQINIHAVSTSGDNSRLFSMLTARTLDMAVGSTIALKDYAGEAISVLQLPFLFSEEGEAEYVIQRAVLPAMKKSLKKSGLLCADIWSMGWRHLTSKGSPIRVPGDLKGRRIRILASDQIKEYFESLGAIPLQIYYNNIKEALATGIIECQENPYSNIRDMEFYRYQDYVTEMRMFYSMEAICISKSSWDELDEGKQEALRQALSESGKWLRERQQEVNRQAKIELLQNGMEIIIPNEREMGLWKETINPLYRNTPYREFLIKLQRAKAWYSKREDPEGK